MDHATRYGTTNYNTVKASTVNAGTTKAGTTKASTTDDSTHLLAEEEDLFNKEWSAKMYTPQAMKEDALLLEMMGSMHGDCCMDPCSRDEFKKSIDEGF